MYQYPYLEKFYRDNFSKLLDRSSSLRPSKSVPKNGAAGVAKFQDFYKKTGLRSFSEDEVLTILNAENVEDGDTIFHQNLRVMRELNFVTISDGTDKKYVFTEEFLSFVESGHRIDCYIIEKLMSISSADDLTMYLNFMICVMREAAIYGQVIQYRDSADKFTIDVDDAEKRKEHQNRIFTVYGFKGDEARKVPENYTPNISYFCHAVLKQLGILVKSDKKIDNMGTLELTPLGEMILKKIDENIFYGQQLPQNKIRTISVKKQIHNSLQQIYYGAPGTGKSHQIEDETEGESVIRTTFHPDSDYSTFVGAYKPSMEPTEMKVVPVVINNGISLNQNEGTFKDNRIVYKFIKQAFLKAYLGAWKKMTEDTSAPKPQYLIIEEINRGNCAQIFGDLFQLLDRGDNGYSAYTIDADTDMQQAIADAFKSDNEYRLAKDIDAREADIKYTSNYDDSTLSKDIQEGRVLLLPKNLFIWATMNTSDQSLFPIDSAFKRRWEWVYMPIKDHRDKDYKIEIDDTTYDWWGFLEKINSVINTVTNSEDKKLGYFFVKTDKKIDAKKFVGKVLFYLWNDVFKNYGFDNPIFNKEDKSKYVFSEFFQKDGTPETENIKKFLKNLDEAIDKEHPYTEKKPEEVISTTSNDNSDLFSSQE
jgi:hypothetical protein